MEEHWLKHEKKGAKFYTREKRERRRAERRQRRGERREKRGKRRQGEKEEREKGKWDREEEREETGRKKNRKISIILHSRWLNSSHFLVAHRGIPLSYRFLDKFWIKKCTFSRSCIDKLKKTKKETRETHCHIKPDWNIW